MDQIKEEITIIRQNGERFKANLISTVVHDEGRFYTRHLTIETLHDIYDLNYLYQHQLPNIPNKRTIKY